MKLPIRLHECAGWSESSVGAHVRRYVFWRCVLSIYFYLLQHHTCTSKTEILLVGNLRTNNYSFRSDVGVRIFGDWRCQNCLSLHLRNTQRLPGILYIFVVYCERKTGMFHSFCYRHILKALSTRDDILNHFSFFPQETEMSKPVFWKKLRKNIIINVSSAEFFTQHNRR